MTFLGPEYSNKIIVVLAIKGVPIHGVPNLTGARAFSFKAMLDQVREAELPARDRRTADVQAWLRAAQEEPFYQEARKFASKLSQTTGCEIILGFYEYGLPTLEEALEQAFAQDAQEIILLDPAMSRYSRLVGEDKPGTWQFEREQGFMEPMSFGKPIEFDQVIQYLAEEVKNIKL